MRGLPAPPLALVRACRAYYRARMARRIGTWFAALLLALSLIYPSLSFNATLQADWSAAAWLALAWLVFAFLSYTASSVVEGSLRLSDRVFRFCAGFLKEERQLHQPYSSDNLSNEALRWLLRSDESAGRAFRIAI